MSTMVPESLVHLVRQAPEQSLSIVVAGPSRPNQQDCSETREPKWLRSDYPFWILRSNWNNRGRHTWEEAVSKESGCGAHPASAPPTKYKMIVSSGPRGPSGNPPGVITARGLNYKSSGPWWSTPTPPPEPGRVRDRTCSVGIHYHDIFWAGIIKSTETQPQEHKPKDGDGRTGQQAGSPRKPTHCEPILKPKDLAQTQNVQLSQYPARPSPQLLQTFPETLRFGGFRPGNQGNPPTRKTLRNSRTVHRLRKCSHGVRGPAATGPKGLGARWAPNGMLKRPEIGTIGHGSLPTGSLGSGDPQGGDKPGPL
jgi:hypothetical protein